VSTGHVKWKCGVHVVDAWSISLIRLLIAWSIDRSFLIVNCSDIQQSVSVPWLVALWRVWWVIFECCAFTWIQTVCFSFAFTNCVTPCSRIFLETLTGAQLVKKFPIFYGTCRFITAFARACHLSLSWARLIQSVPPIPLLEDPF
jgi:hypothetical protein